MTFKCLKAILPVSIQFKGDERCIIVKLEPINIIQNG